MAKDIFRAITEAGNSFMVAVSPKEFEMMGVAEKRKAIIKKLNGIFGMRVVRSVKFFASGVRLRSEGEYCAVRVFVI